MSTSKLSDITKNFERQPFTYTASSLAILASIGLGGAGVWRMVAPGVEAGEAMAYIGAGVAFTAIAVSEMTAAVTLLHADRRDAQDAKHRKWGARGVFAAAIIANLLAGHQGAGAISDALIGPQREPFEARLAAAQSAETVAQASLDRFDVVTSQIMASFNADLEAARNGAAMAVTARRGTLNAQAVAASDRETLRAAPASALAIAKAETQAARAALANAPKPLSETMRWALALLFELVKSVLIWVATPKAARAKTAAKISAPVEAPRGAYGLEALAPVLPFKKRVLVDFEAIAKRATREMIHGMDASARNALMSEAKRIAGWCQHAPRAA